MRKLMIVISLSLALVACTHHTYLVGDNYNKNTKVVKENVTSTEMEGKKSQLVKISPRGGDVQPLSYMPNATAFRMTGDYANNVAITLSPEGELIYFPAPSDITADSEPISLGEGWWLNNQGLGPNSVFTKYTFAEYAALPEVPTPEQLKHSIIPGAKVSGFMELPMKVGEALNNLDAAKSFVKNQ